MAALIFSSALIPSASHRYGSFLPEEMLLTFLLQPIATRPRPLGTLVSGPPAEAPSQVSKGSDQPRVFWRVEPRGRGGSGALPQSVRSCTPGFSVVTAGTTGLISWAQKSACFFSRLGSRPPTPRPSSHCPGDAGLSSQLLVRMGC